MAEITPAATVSVAYGTAAGQSVVPVQWHRGLTARAALDLSGLLDEYPDIDVDNLVLGIFGRPVSENHRLQPGDRVEIGRPLIRDPREMRWEAVAGGGVVGQKKSD
jgi:putative ubiquitin-RnfH superfamily antitoxin RatB of RatAB toxin-antitoxin module